MKPFLEIEEQVMSDRTNEKTVQLDLETYAAKDVYQAAATQQSGLRHEQVKERQKQYGSNRLKEAEKEPVIVTYQEFHQSHGDFTLGWWCCGDFVSQRGTRSCHLVCQYCQWCF